MRIQCIRELFELRKTRALGSRMGVARVFFAGNKLGLTDISGCIWPVTFESKELKLNVGDVISFSGSFSRVDGAKMSKYEDDGYYFKIEKISEAVVSSNEWPNEILRTPLPSPESIVALGPDDHSYFCPSPLYSRRRNLHLREMALTRTRHFFTNRGFNEMETPVLVPSGGVENYLNQFATSYTDHRGKSWDLALPTSPEFSLKKLLAEGFSKIFQLSHCFRNNGELSQWHEPEFLMLEWYRQGAHLTDMMSDTKKFVSALAEAMGSTFSLPEKWPVYRVDELFKDLFDLDLSKHQDADKFKEAGKKLSISVNDSDDWDSVFHKLFFDKIEPFLKSKAACFVTHYPVQMSALAKQVGSEPFVERFEAYLNGIEICNGYQELVDSEELQKRFSGIKQKRSNVTTDTIFEETMAFGLPPSAGNALGLDRVIAILARLNDLSSLYPLPFLSHFKKGTVAED